MKALNVILLVASGLGLLACGADKPSSLADTNALHAPVTSSEPTFVDVVVMQKKPPLRLSIDSGNCFVAKVEGPLVEVALHRSAVRACARQNVCAIAEHFDVRCDEPIALRPDDEHRRFFGKNIKVSARKKGLRVVASVPLEPYIDEVMQSELTGAPLEAAAAQKVLIRTYALHAHLSPRHKDADLCDLTHCQVFAAKRALGMPRADGIFLVDDEGFAADVYYHSTCGGHTVNASKVWPGSSKSMIGVDDLSTQGRAYCEKSPHFTWSTRMSHADLARVLHRLKKKVPQEARIKRDLNGLFIDDSGHRISLSISSFHRAVGKTLGWHRLKSFDFSVTHTPTGTLFAGRGLGHGVGLCQHGAIGRAKSGQSAHQILRAYFPKFHLSAPKIASLTSSKDTKRAEVQP